MMHSSRDGGKENKIHSEHMQGGGISEPEAKKWMLPLLVG